MDIVTLEHRLKKAHDKHINTLEYVKALETKVAELKLQIEEYKGLYETTKELRAENKSHKELNRKLANHNDDYKQANDKLTQENADLKWRLEGLEK